MNSMAQQRREGEANGPQGQRPARVNRGGPSWTEFVRPAHQAVVAFVGADMINRAEPRACGRSRGSRRLDPEPGTKEPQALCQTQPGTAAEGRGATRLASNRNGENPPYGMNRGGGGNVSMTWRPFATMLERADTTEVAGLNWARLRSTRPVSPKECGVSFCIRLIGWLGLFFSLFAWLLPRREPRSNFQMVSG